MSHGDGNGTLRGSIFVSSRKAFMSSSSLGKDKCT